MQEARFRCAECSDGDTKQPCCFFFTSFFYFTSFLCSLIYYYYNDTIYYYFNSFLLFKTLLLYYSLKSQSLDLHCPMLSLIFLKVLVLRLILSHVSSNLWHNSQSLSPQTCRHTTTAAASSIHSNYTSQATNPLPSSQPHPPLASLLYTVANKEVE
jgi:hypothetical protein